MIAVADINTHWRREPFEALSKRVSVLGLAPRDIFSAWREHHKARRGKSPTEYLERSITLPPGWASRFSDLTARKLWAAANQASRTTGQPLSAIVVASPHYLPLIGRARPHVPTFYYCSDDYSQYVGWGGASVLEQEAAIIKMVTHSFFVSEFLAERAVREYGVSSECVSVSPNATDEAFLEPVSEEKICALMTNFPRLCRPLVGVVGDISDRLDFELLLACLDALQAVTLVLVGPVAKGVCDPGLALLQNHPRCVFVGLQPRTDLPTWMQMIDVALIPYRNTPLNRSCSPMRLFDHMASGRPIVATAVCQQIATVAPYARVGRTKREVVAFVREVVENPVSAREVQAQRQQAKAETWSLRAEILGRVISAQKR